MRGGAGFAVGLLFMLFGAFFLIITLFAGYERLEVLWPFFPLGAGLFLLVLGAAVSVPAGRAALVFAGAIPLLLGLFFFSFTLNVVAWRDHSFLWPAYPLVVALGFVAAYVASLRRQWFWLIPAVPTLAVGLIGVFFALPFAPWWREGVARFWPVLLVLIGLLMLLRWHRGPPHSEHSAT